MKTITVSDEDYKILMELSKELQTQDGNGQAFPYFWEPASEKLEPNIHDEGEVVEIYYDTECYDPEEYANIRENIWKEFLVEDGHDEQLYNKDLELGWIDYIKETEFQHDHMVYTSDWEQKTEHNPSLFRSDVEDFVKYNEHHLGRNPRTYSRSIWRMPKMESLISAILRLNPQPKEKIHHEAVRYVFLKNKGE